jgi:hypothetical protein
MANLVRDIPTDGTKNGVAAVLFMQATMVSMDTMSALNSSPWTSENFGADPDKAKTSREYVTHSVIVSGAFSIAASVIAQSFWPLVGMLVTNVYLWWIYDRALKRGAASGSTQWRDQ